MDKAKGLEEIPLEESQGTEGPSSQVEDMEPAVVLSDPIMQHADTISVDPEVDSPTGFLRSVRSAMRKLSQDGQEGTFVQKAADSKQRESRSTARKSSLGISAKTRGSIIHQFPLNYSNAKQRHDLNQGEGNPLGLGRMKKITRRTQMRTTRKGKRSHL